MPAVEEDFPPGMPATEVAAFLARHKAAAMAGTLQPDELLICADTTVVAGDQVLNKPTSRQEATQMLNLLSGGGHQVITGVCLWAAGHEPVVFQEETIVRFRALEPEEIEFYVDQYQPMDKAGAYGIQEWIGMVGVTSIEGSYFNVVGLPTERLYQELKKLLTSF